jgi:hypothetical protein
MRPAIGKSLCETGQVRHKPDRSWMVIMSHISSERNVGTTLMQVSMLSRGRIVRLLQEKFDITRRLTS